MRGLLQRVLLWICVGFPLFWVLLPNGVLIVANPSFGLHLKSLGLIASVICMAPILLLLSRNLLHYYLWNLPFAFLSGFYASFIYFYHDIPYDGMWFALWNTSLNTVSGVTDFFYRYIIFSVLGLIIYICCLFHPALRRWVISKELKQKFVLLSLVFIFLTISATNFMSKQIPIQNFIDETIAVENYPYGMLMMLAKTRYALYKKHPIPITPIVRSQIPKEREIYVLVIGEAARFDYWYEVSQKMQSSLLREPNLKIFSKAISQANFTSLSLPLLLTGTSTIDQANSHPIWPQIAKAAGCTTGWITNSTEPYDYAYDNDFYDLNMDRYAMAGLSSVVYDEVLIPEVQRAIQQGPQKLCLVVHLIGSHFDYRERYRSDLALFPVDKKSYRDFSSDGHDDAFVNAYKNSLIETNYVLENLIKTLKAESGIVFLLYTSDHAESFNDDNDHMYFHGNLRPKSVEFEVPFFIWANDTFKKTYPEKWQAVLDNQDRRITNQQILPTMMDLLSIQPIPDYLPSSLLQFYDHHVKRYVLLPQMELMNFRQLKHSS